MMVPTWWLVLSGLFFFMNIVLFGALAFAAVKLVGILKDLSPRIVAIEKQVQELIKKVQDLTASVQETVSSIGGRAKGVVGSAEGVAQSASRQFERYSPFVIGSLTAIRLVSALNKARMSKVERVTKDSKRGLLAMLPKRKPKTLLGKVIALIRH